MLGSDPPVKRIASGATGGQGWIASVFPESKAGKRAARAERCFAVHSSAAALRWPRLQRKFRRLNGCRTADFAVRLAHGRFALSLMSDRPANGSGNAEQQSADIDAGAGRLRGARDAV